jgi:hypothetical protein
MGTRTVTKNNIAKVLPLSKTNGRPQPATKVLNDALAARKSHYEAAGWVFSRDEQLGWEASRNGTAIGLYEKISDVFAEIEKHAPASEFDAARAAYEEVSARFACVRHGDEGFKELQQEFLSKQKTFLDLEAQALKAKREAPKESESPVDNPEERAREILADEYFSENELREAAAMPLNEGKKHLCQSATNDWRGSGNEDWHYQTLQGKVNFWFKGSPITDVPDAVFTVAAVASRALEKYLAENTETEDKAAADAAGSSEDTEL